MSVVYNVFTGNFDFTGSGGGGGSTIHPFANFAAFPSPVTSGNGYFVVALDTNIVYESNGASWLVVAGPADILAVGTIDSVAASANGAVDNANQLIMQSASVTVPGLVNNTTQSFSGNKTFTGTIGASNLSGTNTGDVTLTAVGSTPNPNGASLSGQALTLQPANSISPGVVSEFGQDFGGLKTFVSNLNSAVVTGTTSAAGNLTLRSTSDATKGKVIIGTSAYDEVNNRLGIGNSTPTAPLDVTGAGVFSGDVTLSGGSSDAKIIYDPSGFVVAPSHPAWETGFRSGQPYYSVVMYDGSTRTTFVDYSLNGIVDYSAIVNAPNLRTTSIATPVGNSVADTSVSGQTLQVSQATDQIQLAVKGNATQTANIFDVLKNDNSVLFSVNNSGNGTLAGTIGASNFSGSSSGTNTGDVSIASFGSSPTANGATLSGQALTLQPADSTHPGSVSIATQSFGGGKSIIGNADEVQFTVKGNGTQTGSLAEFKNSSNTVEVAISKTGQIQANEIYAFAAGDIVLTNGTVFDSSGNTKINWFSGLLNSASTTKALDWVNRELYGTDGTTVLLDWASTSAATLTGNITGNAATATNLAAGAAGQIPYQSASGTTGFSAAGTTGQAVISGGTGAPTFFNPTPGSVLFAGTSGILQQDNASLFFDDTNNRLGLLTAAPASTLHNAGTYQGLVTSVSADTSLGTHQYLAVDNTGGNKTITLPAASSTIIGRTYYVKKNTASANTVIIATTGSDTLDGVTGVSAFTMSSPYQSVTLVCLSATTWGIF